MKNLIKGVFLLFFIIGMIVSGQGQCVPDTANCKDIDKPGQICPDSLPVALLNTYYEQVITIIPPYEFDLGDGVIPIHKILIDSVHHDCIPNLICCARFYRYLINNGHKVVKKPSEADFIIINSCGFSKQIQSKTIFWFEKFSTKGIISVI